MAAKNMIQTN